MKRILIFILFLGVACNSTNAKEVTLLEKMMYGEYIAPIKVSGEEEFTYIYYLLNHYLLSMKSPKNYEKLTVLKNKCNELGRLFSLVDFVELNREFAKGNLSDNSRQIDYIQSLQKDVGNHCRSINEIAK